MASIAIDHTTKGMEGLVPGIGKRVNKRLAQAVGDSLLVIEQQHKLKEIGRPIRSGGRAVSKTWSNRSGNLSKSFRRDWKTGKLEGAYGSPLFRAEKVEEGGTIRAKKSYLTIPTEHAPKGVSARNVPGLVFIQSLKGQPLLVKPTGTDGGFLTMFILRRQVKLPPRPALARAVKATEKKRAKIIDAAIDKGVG